MLCFPFDGTDMTTCSPNVMRLSEPLIDFRPIWECFFPIPTNAKGLAVVDGTDPWKGANVNSRMIAVAVLVVWLLSLHYS